MATTQMKALMLGIGTTFLSTAGAMITVGNYTLAVLLVLVGLLAFYIREVSREEIEAR